MEDKDQMELDFSGVTTIDLGNGYGVSDTVTIPNTYVTDDDYTITLDNSYGYGAGSDSFQWTLTDTSKDGLNIESGDLTIQGRSMKEFMDKVEKRLAILQPNEELEEQWEELKKLGEKYRELEEQLLERNKIMDILKED